MGDNEYCGWSLSWIFYILAIISAIIAIIIAIVAGVKNGDDVDANVEQNWQRAACFFFLAIVLVLLAIYAGGAELSSRKGMW